MQNHLTIIRPEPDIHLTAYVKPEALAFFGEHGCMIQQQQQGGDLVIFPPGSRQEPLSSRSRRCSAISAILLPDGTTITAIECCTKYIVLLIDIVHGQTTHLSH
jgi:hypothetical protein